MHVIQWNRTFLTLKEWKWCENVKENSQHRRWVWRRSASQCDRHCCLRKHHTGGTLLSPAQTAGPGRRRAHNPPSCWSKRGRDCGLTIITFPLLLSFTVLSSNPLFYLVFFSAAVKTIPFLSVFCSLTLHFRPWGNAQSQNQTPSHCCTRRWTHGDGPGSIPRRRQWSDRETQPC